MKPANSNLNAEAVRPIKSSQSKKSRSRAKNKRIIIAASLIAAAAIAGFVGYSVLNQKDAQDYLAAAREMETKGDAGAAVIEYKNVLQADPANPEARLQLGKLYYARYKFDAAEKELSVASKSGKYPEASPLLARSMLQLNAHQRLLDEIQPIVGASPAINAEIHALRARAQMALGDVAAYQETQRLADEQQPNHPASQFNKALRMAQQGQMEQALVLLEEALAQAPKQPDLWLLKGDLLTNGKRLPEAISAYDQVIKLEPGNVRALLAGANLAMQSNQLDQAASRVKAARAVSPDNLIVRYQEAMLEFRHGRPAEALAKVQDVLKSAPDFLPARLLAGTAALASGKTESALKDLEYVVAQSPQNAAARKLLAVIKMQSGQGKEAKDLLSKLDPKLLDDPMLLSAQGNLALRNRDYAEARRTLQRAAELKPDQPKLLTELAASQMGSGDESAAIASLERAAGLEQSGDAPDLLLIQTHIKAKRYEAALKVIDRLEKKNPQSPIAANLRGAIAAANGDQTQARAHFSRAMQLQPGYLPAANNLAQLDVQAKDFKSARQRFENVIQHDPKSVGAWISLARLAALQKDDKAYLESLEKAKIIAPDNASARELLIKYWMTKKDFGRVIAESREALTATGNKAFYDPLGIAQAQQGSKLDTLSTYQKWVEAAPNSPLAHFRLAIAQESNDKRADAITSLDKALQLAPDFPDAVLMKTGLLSAQGKLDQALKLARDFQKRHPNSPIGYAAEATAQAQAKHPAEAAKLFERAANLSGQGRFLLQAKAAYVAAGQLAAAEKSASDWLVKQPNDASVRHALAQIQLDSGRHKEAVKHYELLLKANPNDLVALNNSAWAYGALNDNRALPAAEKAYQLLPKNPAVLDTYGWLLARNGQAKRGIPLLQQAVAGQPETAEIRWHLAAALAQSGDKTNAIVELDRLLASRIPFAQAAEARALLQQLQQGK